MTMFGNIAHKLFENTWNHLVLRNMLLMFMCCVRCWVLSFSNKANSHNKVSWSGTPKVPFELQCSFQCMRFLNTSLFKYKLTDRVQTWYFHKENAPTVPNPYLFIGMMARHTLHVLKTALYGEEVRAPNAVAFSLELAVVRHVPGAVLHAEDMPTTTISCIIYRI